MQQGSRTHQRRVAELARAIDESHSLIRPVLATYAQDIQEVLGADAFVAYSLKKERPDANYEVYGVHAHDFPVSASTLKKAIGKVSRPWGYFDPVKPAPEQRNQALSFDDLRARLGPPPRSHQAVLSESRVSGLDQVRSLVCEDGLLLAWVGCLREGRFSRAARDALQALTPAIRRAVWSEHLLAPGQLLRAAFDAALESVGAASFVIDGTGRVVVANSSGQALLRADRACIGEELLHAVRDANGNARREPTRFCVKPLRTGDTRTYYLAVARAEFCDSRALACTAARRWQLTRQQTRVLELVVKGMPNKLIAAELGNSERTIEVHVSAVLQKSGAGSRAGLVSSVWRGGR